MSLLLNHPQASLCSDVLVSYQVIRQKNPCLGLIEESIASASNSSYTLHVQFLLQTSIFISV